MESENLFRTNDISQIKSSTQQMDFSNNYVKKRNKSKNESGSTNENYLNRPAFM